MSPFKGKVRPKMKILSPFTHTQVIPNMYEFISSVEHKIKIYTMEINGYCQLIQIWLNLRASK